MRTIEVFKKTPRRKGFTVTEILIAMLITSITILESYRLLLQFNQLKFAAQSQVDRDSLKDELIRDFINQSTCSNMLSSNYTAIQKISDPVTTPPAPLNIYNYSSVGAGTLKFAKATPTNYGGVRITNVNFLFSNQQIYAGKIKSTSDVYGTLSLTYLIPNSPASGGQISVPLVLTYDDVSLDITGCRSAYPNMGRPIPIPQCAHGSMLRFDGYSWNCEKICSVGGYPC